MSISGLGLYLDLFTDEQQIENFRLVHGLENGGEEVDKFEEVFKNNIQTLDDIDLSQGHLCTALNGCIDSAFGGANNTVDLLYQPSITAMRISSVDRFTYEVKFDLSLSVNRNLVDSNTFGEKKYIVGNAVVKDILCQVTFTPKFSYSDDSPQMKYDVEYRIAGGNYKATYGKILYVYNGKVRSKNISGSRSYNINVEGISNGDPGKALSEISTEIVVNKLLGMLTSGNINPIVSALN